MTPLPWLANRQAEFHQALAANRRAHAYLLSGPRGVGKRALAAVMSDACFDAERRGVNAPHRWPEHADFHRIAPAEDKTALSVDQVRELIGELAMTAYAGATKVAIIEAADTLSIAAANALLKTLEEPPGDCCIVLIADRLLNLPATILSRCSHWKIAAPSMGDALAWMAHDDRAQAERALAMAAGAPLLAADWIANGTIDTWDRLHDELAALVDDGGDATALATAWSKHEAALVLKFLLAMTEAALHVLLKTGSAMPENRAITQIAERNVDARHLFCYLDRLRRLLSQPKGSYSAPAVFETLLLAWQGGFRSLGDEAPLLPDVAAGQL
ncbi:MAG: hypothetical protein AAGC71_14310 [Pseudomonadota bacterium]